MRDLTRDDLARLRDLIDHIHRGHNADAAYADATALLTEALDRREGLVFGPPVGESHLRCAVSVDGHLYQIRDDATGEDEPCEDIVEWMHVKSGDGDTNVVGVEKAIKQARAHDATRRGGR